MRLPQPYARIIELARKETPLDEIPADLQEPLRDSVQLDRVEVKAGTMRDPLRVRLRPEGVGIWLEMAESDKQVTDSTDSESPLEMSGDAGDPTAYVPVSELLDSEFQTLKAINKALEENPRIRKRRPIGKRTGQPVPNRLEIHTGDWHRFKKQGRTIDPLDSPAEMVDEAIEAAGRQAEIRQLKGEK